MQDLLLMGRGVAEVRGEAPNRGLFSLMSIKAGQRTLFENSLNSSYCLDIREWKQHCQYCLFRPTTTPLKRCSGCRQAHYCNLNCQSEHWSVHQNECKTIAALFDTPDIEVLRDILMIYRSMTDPALKSLMDMLCEVELPLVNHTFEMLAENCLQIPFLSEFSVKEIASVVAKFQINSFALTGEFIQPIGHGIFARSAMINHSCHPNLAVCHLIAQGKKPVQAFIALRDIEPGEELTHCYVNQLHPRELRQQVLSTQYGFDCACPRCGNPPPVDLNYTRFPPSLLAIEDDEKRFNDQIGKEIDQLEKILASKPHWSLRFRYYQHFTLLMQKHDFRSAQKRLLQMMTYDRLILSPHHPTVMTLENLRVFLNGKLSKKK